MSSAEAHHWAHSGINVSQTKKHTATHCNALQHTESRDTETHRTETLYHTKHTMTKARREIYLHWCCFYDSVRNSLVVLLETLIARSTLYHAATHCNTPPTRDAQERWPLIHWISERERETLAHSKRTLIAFCHVSENLPLCCLFYDTMNIYFCFFMLKLHVTSSRFCLYLLNIYHFTYTFSHAHAEAHAHKHTCN